MLIFCFFVPKMCKSANNETKNFLGYLVHGFMFASKKLDSLMGILGKKILRLVYSCRHFCPGTNFSSKMFWLSKC